METLLSPLRYWLLLSCLWLALISCEPDKQTTNVVSQIAFNVPDTSLGVSDQMTVSHLDTARSYIGISDNGNNTGRDVTAFLKATGLPAGNPWCAAFVAYCLNAAGNILFPPMRTALATGYITARSMKASRVIAGIDRPEPGAIVIYRKGNGIFGHAGFVIEWDQVCGQTIEGNTSPSSTAGIQEQVNGEGVWEKYRCIEPGNYFRIVSFTPVITNTP